MTDQNKVPSNESLDKMRGDLDRVKRDWDQTMEGVELCARLRYAKYRAYMSAGFSEEQALDLVAAEFV